jgi:hypothetical protein
MERDIKDVIGVLMRVLDGGEVSQEDLDDLEFEADGELEEALNEAYVKLREFASDRDLRLRDPKVDRGMRSDLQACLDKIVRACDRTSRTASHHPSSSEPQRSK